MLKRRADHVGREVITIRNTGSRASGGGTEAPRGPMLGGPMTGTIPPHLVPGPEPFFSTSLVYPIRNAWVASDHRHFIAVEAGADPVHPSTGVLGIFRQNYVRVSQSQRVVRLPGAGPLRLRHAPGGSGRAALRNPAATVRFSGEKGVTGTLDLKTGRVVMDSGSGSGGSR